nr:MAG TPA: Tail tape measure [Caudoviricetes sp.]DAS89045.1 MAG TPA: Tail tape measure [Caudoviricetes sp.]DAT57815.1 MAG TPA: Tail tape measure [Caudoviricetes sp.]
MYNAMNILISSFERMQNIPGNLVDTKSIAAARSELSNVKTVLSGAEKGAKKLNTASTSAGNAVKTIGQSSANISRVSSSMNSAVNSTKRFSTATTQSTQGLRGLVTSLTNVKSKIVSATTTGVSKFKQLATSMKESSSSGNSLVGVLGKVAAAVGSVMGVKQIIGLSDTMSQTKARLDLMNDGLQSTKELQDRIFDSAQKSRGSYQDTADLVSKLGLNAKDAFENTAQIVDFAEQVNKQFVISGASAEETKNATLQLTQALSSGVLRGDELRSIFEQAPTLIQSIANYMGVPIGRIRDMAAEGQITAETVKNALLECADETNAKFASMPLTFSQLWTNFKNRAMQAFQPVLEKINELANNGRLEEYIGKIAEAMATVSDVIMNVITWVLDHQDIVKAAFIGLSVAIGAMTVAMWAFNIASYANPVIWIVLAIIAVIALLVAGIVLVVEHWNEIKDAASACWEGVKSAWGNVTDFFKGIWDKIVSGATGLWNSIVSIFTTIKNFFVSIWNSMYTVVSTFWGAIWNTISPIVMAIWNLISTIFTVIWTIISTIMQGIFHVISNVWNVIYNAVSGVLISIWNIITSIWNIIYTAVSGVLSSIWGAVSSIWNSIYNAISGVLSSIFNTVSNIWNNIFSVVRNKVVEIYNNVKDKFTEILNYLGGLKDKFLQKGHEMIDGLITGIADKINGVTSKIKELGEKAVGAIKQFFNINSPSKVMRELGNFTFEGFNLGLADQINAIKNTSLNMGAVVTANSIPDLKTNLSSNYSGKKDFSAMRETIASKTTNNTIIKVPVNIKQDNDIVMQNGENTDTLIKKLSRGMEENAQVVWKGVLA